MMPNFEDPSNPPALVVPHNREAEEGLLGSILIYPDAYLQVATFLNSEDFYIHRHRWIWEAIAHLHENRIPVDFLTVIDALDRAGKLGEVGGPAYLTALTNAVPSSLHAEAYGRIVAEMAVRRRMLEAANQIARAAYELEQPLNESLNQAEGAIFEVARQSLDRDLTPVVTIVSEVYDEVAHPSAKTMGISTGLIDLEKLLGGLRKSDFIVLAGRPGMGKTSLLLSILKHATVKLHKHAALFSLEMDNENVVQRLLSQLSEIPLSRIRDHKLREQDWVPFTQANEILGGVPLFLDDTPILTPTRLRTQCRRLALDQHLDLVVVDYLQLMSGGSRFDNRTQEVSHISRQLKILARELQVPMLVSAQLSRAVEQRQDKRPTLADLRESGAIEQDSDIVMFLYRDETAGVTKLAVEKHRNGPTGIIDLVFRGAYTQFENAASE
jgi:replicative DNA helicase